MSTKEKIISAIKGTKDILPREVKLWQKVEKTARDVFERFNYREIRTPSIEKTELFARSIGEATDIVEKEMFSFTDRNDESITLRPEGTASVVRACIEHNLVSPDKLAKFYYIGPMFRYEKPQKGRQRQFHQLGAEAIGLDDPLIDAELIYMCKEIFDKLELKDFKILINSLGTPASRKTFREHLVGFLCENCSERIRKNPLRFFDCKESSCNTLVKKAPKILDYLDEESLKHLEELKEGLKRLEVSFEINPYMVRGLDYYTKTVFEFTSSGLGAQNSILGGGR